MFKKISILLLIALIVISTTNIAKAENVEIRYEAEEGETFQCNNAGTHVAQIDLEGSYVNLELYDTNTPGIYKLKVYYAAAIEGTNTHTLFVNEEKVKQLNYPTSNLGWGTFSEDVYTETEITLKSGENYIRLERTADDTGFAEIDAISLTPVTLYTPDPSNNTPTPKPTEEKTISPSPTITTTPTSVKIIDNQSSFNYLYIVIPAVVVIVVIVAILLVKKKANR